MFDPRAPKLTGTLREREIHVEFPGEENKTEPHYFPIILSLDFPSTRLRK